MERESKNEKNPVVVLTSPTTTGDRCVIFKALYILNIPCIYGIYSHIFYGDK